MGNAGVKYKAVQSKTDTISTQNHWNGKNTDLHLCVISQRIFLIGLIGYS